MRLFYSVKLPISVLVLLGGGLFLVPVSAQANEEPPGSAVAANAASSKRLQPFFDTELARPYFAREASRECARLALVNWRKQEIGAWRVNCRRAAKDLRSPKKAWEPLSTQARSFIESNQVGKGATIYMIGYEASSKAGGISTQATIDLLYTIAALLNRGNSNEDESKMSAELYERARSLRDINGDLEPRDAPYMLQYADVLIDLKRWTEAEGILKAWREIFNSLGKSPPEKELPDALVQLGRCSLERCDFPKAEEYFRDALYANRKEARPSITPLAHVDIGMYLIFSLIDQNKMTQARQYTKEHLSERELAEGIGSPDLSVTYRALAEKYDKAGQISLADQLRARANQQQ